jgi:hypothetical protein
MSQTFRAEDAHKFWCPHSRVTSVVNDGTNSGIAVVVVNRHPERRNEIEDTHCIGDRCANWQWKNDENRQQSDEGRCGLSG